MEPEERIEKTVNKHLMSIQQSFSDLIKNSIKLEQKYKKKDDLSDVARIMRKILYNTDISRITLPVEYNKVINFIVNYIEE